MGTDREHIEDLVQACLESIESGQETIESVLARYPDQADELRSALEAAAWLSSRSDQLNPRPGFATASRARLVEQIQREALAQQTVFVERMNFWQALKNRVYQSQLTYALMAMIFLVLALFTVTGGAVLAASDTLPGDSLYPVKLAYEKVQLSVSLSTATKANLHIEFAQRRLTEIQTSVEEGRYESVKMAVDDMQWQVSQTIHLLNNAANSNPGKAHELAVDLRTTLSKQDTALLTLAGKAPPQARSDLEKAALVSEQNLIAVEGILGVVPSPVPALVTDTATATVAASLTPTLSFTLSPSATVTPPFTPIPTVTPGGTATPSPITVGEHTHPTDTPTLRPERTPRPKKTHKPHPTQSHKTPKP